MGVNSVHLDVGVGTSERRLNQCWELGLGLDCDTAISISPLVFVLSPGGTGFARLSSSQDNGAWLPISVAEIIAACTVSSRGLVVDTLDGAGKGDGETDEEADTKWGR